jgi:hypothetical protein
MLRVQAGELKRMGGLQVFSVWLHLNFRGEVQWYRMMRWDHEDGLHLMKLFRHRAIRYRFRSKRGYKIVVDDFGFSALPAEIENG